MADPGEGPRPPCPLFLDQTEAQRAEKNFFGEQPSLWIRHWYQTMVIDLTGQLSRDVIGCLSVNPLQSHQRLEKSVFS